VRTFWQFFLIDLYNSIDFLEETSWKLIMIHSIATSILGRACSIPYSRVLNVPFQSILDEYASLDGVVFEH